MATDELMAEAAAALEQGRVTRAATILGVPFEKDAHGRMIVEIAAWQARMSSGDPE